MPGDSLQSRANVDTRRARTNQGPQNRDRGQKFRVVTAIALAAILVTTGVAHAASSGRCEASTTQLDAASEPQALRVGDAGGIRVNPTDSKAFTEMLHGEYATPLRWDRVPELVVLMPVMQYEKGRGTQYRATAQQLTAAEADALVADLSRAMSVLTDGVLQGFAAVHRETATAGEVVNVMRPGQIVVARYDGVREQLSTIGFGGRSTRSDLIRAGSIILDNDFDRTSAQRRLLRTHELGHALGYNHVHSRASIMNPKIGHEPNDFDRAVARVAFQNFERRVATSCS